MAQGTNRGRLNRTWPPDRRESLPAIKVALSLLFLDRKPTTWGILIPRSYANKNRPLSGSADLFSDIIPFAGPNFPEKVHAAHDSDPCLPVGVTWEG